MLSCSISCERHRRFLWGWVGGKEPAGPARVRTWGAACARSLHAQRGAGGAQVLSMSWSCPTFTLLLPLDCLHPIPSHPGGEEGRWKSREGSCHSPPPAAVTPKSLLVDGAVERGWKVSKGRGLVMGRGGQPDGRSR